MNRNIDDMLEAMGKDAPGLQDSKLSQDETDKIYAMTMDKINKEKTNHINKVNQSNFGKKHFYLYL